MMNTYFANTIVRRLSTVTKQPFYNSYAVRGVCTGIIMGTIGIAAYTLNQINSINGKIIPDSYNKYVKYYLDRENMII